MADCPIFAPASPKMPADRLGLRGTVKREYDQSSAERMTRNVDGEFNRLTTYYGCATVTFASLADAASVAYNIPVHGPLFGTHYAVRVFVNVDLDGLSMSGYVSADDRVTVVFQNDTGAAVQPAASFEVCVIVERYPVGQNSLIGSDSAGTIAAGSAGGDTVITPPIGFGNLVLTGYQPSLIVGTGNVAITPPLGNLILTGYAPTPSATANVVIAEGSGISKGGLVLTGYAPTLSVVEYGDAVNFDGSTYMSTSSGMGASASKLMTSVAWIKIAAGSAGSTPMVFSCAGALSMYLSVNTTGKIRFTGGSPGSSSNMRTTSDFSSTNGWICVMASWDTNDVLKCKLFVNDTDELDSAAAVTHSFTDPYNNNNWFVGAQDGGGNKWWGCQYYVACWPGVYTNFTTTSERRKFYSDVGEPVDIGSDGSTPFGTVPAFYVKLASATSPVTEYALNLGNGSDFSISGTGLTKCANSPNTD